ncbi:hypothetical protein EJ110_NYTH36715 [Nymphaea thermarum]|nr:hypothetical protein EJ110_NYTH36715 [Nymphaea thermarum]
MDMLRGEILVILGNYKCTWYAGVGNAFSWKLPLNFHMIMLVLPDLSTFILTTKVEGDKFQWSVGTFVVGKSLSLSSQLGACTNYQKYVLLVFSQRGNEPFGSSDLINKSLLKQPRKEQVDDNELMFLFSYKTLL